MKRKFMVATLSLAALTTVALSCKKEEATVPSADLVLNTSNISGQLKVNTSTLNDTNGIAYDAYGSNIEILARLNTKDWVYNVDSASNYTYPDSIYRVTTDAEGNFSLDVMVSDKGSSVVLYVSEFELETTQDSLEFTTTTFGDDEHIIQAKSGEKVFKELNY